jgi:hypothetical protein
MGGILDLVTGSGSAKRSVEEGLSGQSDLYQKGIDKLTPWSETGQSALEKLMASLSQKEDPSKYYNQIISGYSESPYAKLLQEKGIRSANQAGAASGMLGSGEEQKWLTDYSQKVSSADMDNYFKNIFGINDSYEKGLGGVSSEGLGSAGSQMGAYGKLGDSYLQGKEDQGSIEQQGKGSLLGMVGSSLGYLDPFNKKK